MTARELMHADHGVDERGGWQLLERMVSACVWDRAEDERWAAMRDHDRRMIIGPPLYMDVARKRRNR